MDYFQKYIVRVTILLPTIEHQLNNVLIILLFYFFPLTIKSRMLNLFEGPTKWFNVDMHGSSKIYLGL